MTRSCATTNWRCNPFRRFAKKTNLSRKPDAGGVVVLDGVDATRPLIVSKTASDALSRRVRSFERGTVVDFEAEPKDDPKEDAALRAAKQQYGV
jgi:hypothetical protein